MSFFSNKVAFFHINLGLPLFFLYFFVLFVVDLLRGVLLSTFCDVFCQLIAADDCVTDG